MSLKDTITEVVEDFNKRKNKSEVWETLEKKLIKNGLKKEYQKMVNKMDSSEAYELLKVWDALDEHFNKKKHRWNNIKNVEMMETLSEIDDIEEAIKTLADSGYVLNSFMPSPISTVIYLEKEDIEFFKALAKDGLFQKYDSVFKTLSKFGYKSISNYKNMYDQADYLLRMACLEGDVMGSIYVLANSGYKIDGTLGLNRLDLKNIKKITEKNKKEISEGKGGIPIYLYNTGNLEIFQDYFISLKAGNKKSVLKSVLEYEIKQELQEQNKIRDWLEKDYENLIREVGFKDV